MIEILKKTPQTAKLQNNELKNSSKSKPNTYPSIQNDDV